MPPRSSIARPFLALLAGFVAFVVATGGTFGAMFAAWGLPGDQMGGAALIFYALASLAAGLVAAAVVVVAILLATRGART